MWMATRRERPGRESRTRGTRNRQETRTGRDAAAVPAAERSLPQLQTSAPDGRPRSNRIDADPAIGGRGEREVGRGGAGKRAVGGGPFSALDHRKTRFPFGYQSATLDKFIELLSV